MKNLALLMMSAQAISATINQQTAEALNSDKAHHYQHKSVGDSFFAKPVEGYPVENSLALTSAFIYGHSHTGKVVKMGEFEMDLLWVYILVVIIVIGAVVGGIICCCTGGEDKPAEMMEKMEEEKKEDEENKMEDMMMEPEMMAAE